jgi:hypothetical protein
MPKQTANVFPGSQVYFYEVLPDCFRQPPLLTVLLADDTVAEIRTGQFMIKPFSRYYVSVR